MKYLLTVFLLVQFSLNGNAQVAEQSESTWTTLEEGKEISISTGNGKIDRISIVIQNLLDQESTVYYTQYVGEKESPENEIGPRKYRTSTLAPKISDENEPVRPDKKEIVLNTGQADKIVVRVEKGKIKILYRAVSK